MDLTEGVCIARARALRFEHLVYDRVGQPSRTGVVCLTGGVAEVLRAAIFLNALIDGRLGFAKAGHEGHVRRVDGEPRLHDGIHGRDVGHQIRAPTRSDHPDCGCVALVKVRSESIIPIVLKRQSMRREKRDDRKSEP